jgi:hypothetical protein
VVTAQQLADREAVEVAATELGNAVGTLFARLLIATESIEKAEVGVRRYIEAAIATLMDSPTVTVLRDYLATGATGDARLLLTELLTLRRTGGRS